ncbi:hypothetical protein [Paenibacillus pini]|uniref:hypothetical protein n=1 Tax=Paenibacillus pini TaxID=669461 RepID=UPI000560A7EB|nr:hypothetical protein [Paenibacillus pini]
MTVFLNNDENLQKLYQYNTYAEDRVLRVRLQIKNKKEWFCISCNETIPVGDGSAYHTGMSGGVFYHYHLCLSCYEQ